VSHHVYSFNISFFAVEFANIVSFFTCVDVDLVCRICSLILWSYERFVLFFFFSFMFLSRAVFVRRLLGF